MQLLYLFKIRKHCELSGCFPHIRLWDGIYIHCPNETHKRSLTADTDSKILGKMLNPAPSEFGTLPYLSRPEE